jgi:hypothetical protein
MAAYRSQYEVSWQLPDDEDPLEDVSSMEVGSLPAAEYLESMAQLAGVDAAAIVRGGEAGLVVEWANPPASGLRPGAVIQVHPSLSGPASGTFSSLMSGALPSSRCSPPRGFACAALVSWSLATSGRLLLVANRYRRVTELNLRLAAAHVEHLSTQEGHAGPRQYKTTHCKTIHCKTIQYRTIR